MDEPNEPPSLKYQKTDKSVSLSEEIPSFICRWFFICCGEFGIYRFPSSVSAMVNSMEGVDNAIFCIASSTCEHKESTTTAILNASPILPHVTYFDILAFQVIVSSIPNFELLQSWPIDCRNVLKVCNYFLISLNLCQSFMESLSSLDFVHAISALSAQLVSSTSIDTRTKKNFTFEQILRETKVDTMTRLKFLLPQHASSMFTPRFVELSDAALLLSVEENILECLNETTCVVAGGAALKIANPQSTFTNRCDVDVFILHNELQIQHLQKLLHLLAQSGRHIFHQGHSVFSAIGAYGVRRIQVIVSACNTAQAVIKEFDLLPLEAFYDGTFLQSTVGANYDWCTKKCNINSFIQIRPLRLFSMYWKGFEISTAGLKFLENTIGFPPREDILNDFLYKIPYVVDEHIVPLQVQHAALYRLYQLTPFLNIDCLTSKDEAKTNNPFAVILFNSGFYSGSDLLTIYHGELQDYVKTCCTVANETRVIQIQNLRPTLRRYISCSHSLEFYCSVQFVLDSETGKMEIQVTNLPDKDVKNIHETIPKQLMQSCLSYANIQDKLVTVKTEWQTIFVKASKHTQFFQDGLSTLCEHVPTKQTLRARVIIRPRNFYEEKLQQKQKNIDYFKLQWECSHVFVKF